MPDPQYHLEQRMVDGQGAIPGCKRNLFMYAMLEGALRSLYIPSRVTLAYDESSVTSSR